MAEKQTQQQKIKALTDRLETGIQEIYTSEKYAAYLSTMAKFHSYSTRNTVLIHMQMPEATCVAGFRAWKEKFGRTVKKGEKGIRILAPMSYTVKKEMQKLDPDTQVPLIGQNGEPVLEEVEITIPRFRAVSVFDLSQTEGEPLPSLVEDLTGSVEQYEAFLAALERVSPLPIRFEPLDKADGICRYDSEIAIREGMSQPQTICAILHEITHAKLHHPPQEKDRNTQEVEAESVAWVVAQRYGVDTGANSFGYISGWSRGKDTKELRASLDTIRETANDLIDAIDRERDALTKEQGIALEPRPQEPVTGEPLPPDENVPSEPVPSEPEAGNPLLPDPAIGPAQRDQYGYTTPDMLPLTMARALDLFDRDLTVYVLHPDGTEEMAFEQADITAAETCIFGIEQAEWEGTQEYAEMVAAEKHKDGIKEAILLHGPEDRLAIYQLRDGDSTRDYRWRGLNELSQAGLAVDRANYELVHISPLAPTDTLDGIFQTYNESRPADFTGHSLSVGDVVVLQRDGEVSSHYVDSTGFAVLSDFLGCETREPTSSQLGNTLEQTPEPPTGPTVAELEAQVKAGERISLMDLSRAVKQKDRADEKKARPSVLAQLQQYGDSERPRRTPGQTKSAELEV